MSCWTAAPSGSPLVGLGVASGGGLGLAGVFDPARYTPPGWRGL
ncbi:MAG: hypothetical protein M5U05_12615 [Anaerolineales bacterium]|nr:hypothetical protein [Anaerolineales bacterium]